MTTPCNLVARSNGTAWCKSHQKWEDACLRARIKELEDVLRRIKHGYGGLLDRDTDRRLAESLPEVKTK